MTTELKLPDMGGDVEEVTVTRWLVSEGDEIKEGDIILEVATDKVDSEIAATASGIVSQILATEGELITVNAVLANLDSNASEVPVSTQPDAEHEPTPTPSQQSEPKKVDATPVAQRVAEAKGVALEEIEGSGLGGRVTKKDVMARVDAQGKATGEALDGDSADVVDPVVQRLAAENAVDLRKLAGEQPLSAITKEDVLKAAGVDVISRPKSAPTSTSSLQPSPVQLAGSTPNPAPKPQPKSTEPDLKPGEEFIPHSRIRLLTARTTSKSAQTIPHVTTWHDVSMANVLAHRKAHKAEFAEAGVQLTVTTYLIQAAVAGLKAVPQANSTWTDEGLIVRRNYDIGMAVALPGGGLIVPVIKKVDDLSLMGVARSVNDLAERGRSGKLKLDELQGGSFTVTNYGTSGSRFQTPIIVEGQAAILGVGAIEKRPIIVSQGHPLEANTGDYLAFLPILTLGLSYDHRILDGATADAVCLAIKETLENWQ